MALDQSLQSTDLKPLHTFGLQARARAVQSIFNLNDVHRFSKLWLDQGPDEHCLLGEGSNTVFVTDQIHRQIWRMELKGREFLGVQSGAYCFRVWAGENWHNWVEWTVLSGFPGLENLALIPGSVGASPVQNIGAYGLELCERISGVLCWDHTLQAECWLSAAECGFAYRDSLFKREGAQRYLILAVDFRLPVQWEPITSYGDVAVQLQDQIKSGRLRALDVMQTIIGIRSSKLPDPTVLGNSGSFFKNPIVPSPVADALRARFPKLVSFPYDAQHVKVAAGWLIDQCGLKGFNLGGCRVYERQALILVNHGGGTAAELKALIEHVQNSVHQQFGLELEPEPNLIA